MDVEEFLSDVSMHLRRRELKTLLHYIGISSREIDCLLYDAKARAGTERGLLMQRGAVVEGSSSVNFLEQRIIAMYTWWEYAANGKQRNTPSQQKLKVVESATSALPSINEYNGLEIFSSEGDGLDKITDTAVFPPIRPGPIPQKRINTPLPDEYSVDLPKAVFSKSQNGLTQLEECGNGIEDTESRALSQTVPPDRQNSGTHGIGIITKPIVQVPAIETDSDEQLTSIKSSHTKTFNTSDISEQEMVDRSQQTDLVGCDPSPDQVAIYGTNVTLEELLRKLWRSLHACGLKKVVEDLQQRWLIQIDVKHGRADMYPKMTWGTPLPPQTPFTYPPYKKIGHMAVMGSTMSIETKSYVSALELTPRLSKHHNESMDMTKSFTSEPAKTSKFLPSAIREQLNSRAAKSRGITSVSLDGAPVTSFPTRDSWKLRTDTVRRKGAAVTIRITVDDVTLPTQPSTTWGSSLHVSPQQVRERVARVFLSHIIQDSRNLSKTVDRIERIRGLVVESAQRRIGGGGTGVEITSSELVLQCRCLQSETVEQLWLLYQSGQLRENIQAGLVTKRAQQTCAVEHLRVRVNLGEEEYRRALGLLRRKPMPNTKTGRFYVTSGTGGAIGGAGGLAHAQKQALMSVTRYMKLPASTPHLQSLPPVPPTTSLANNDLMSKKPAPVTVKSKTNSNLVHKVLAKELDTLRERLRMCEDNWCNFAANEFSYMLRCARHVMQRRIVGATVKTQLTPRCTSLSIFLALWKSINAPKTGEDFVSPRVPHAASVTCSHSNIALYPSDITFANVDLVTTVDDDDNVVKSRKKEERDFMQGYFVFSDIITELGTCRNILQDRIISRLTTNPTVAPSKHLFLAKDIYNLMERWRYLLTKDFNFANDESVQRFSSRILSNDIVTTSFDKEIQEQFPGIVGIIPLIFHIAEKIMLKLRDLLPTKDSVATTSIYPALATPRNARLHSRYFSSWLKA
ncbi:uncharacterized protein LOC143448475 isoform X2 [Clavelina lepadiformis]